MGRVEVDLRRAGRYRVPAMISRRSLTRLGIALGLSLGVTMGACKGKNTVSPDQCLRDCEQTCPYTPDGLGDNDDYMACVEACADKCSG